MSSRRAVALALGLASGACFSGEGSLGAACRDDADCGDDQRCVNEVCGHCADETSVPGELCLIGAVELEDAPTASGSSLHAADLDRDGDLDLVTHGALGSPERWDGNGRGGWILSTRVNGLGIDGPIAMADLNGNDALDLVAASGSRVTVALANGDSWRVGPPLMHSASVNDLAVAPASSSGPGWVAWVDEQGLWGSGVALEEAALTPPLLLDEGRALAVADAAHLDDRHGPDLPVVDLEARRFEPWFDDGMGGLAPGEPIELEARPVDVFVVDLEGDGDPDLLVPDEEGGVSIIAGDGHGTLALVERPQVPGPAHMATVADLNRDGTRDLVVAADADSTLWVFLGRGTRHPDPIALPVTKAVPNLVAIDGDLDGLTELLLSPEGIGPLRVVEVVP